METLEPFDTTGMPKYLRNYDEQWFRYALEWASWNLYEMAVIIYQAMDYCRWKINSTLLRAYYHDINRIHSLIDPEEDNKKKHHPWHDSYTISNYVARISYIAEHYINTYYKNKPVDSITVYELSLFPPSDHLLDKNVSKKEMEKIIGKIRIDKDSDINQIYWLLKWWNILSWDNEIPISWKDPLYIALQTRKKSCKVMW